MSVARFEVLEALEAITGSTDPEAVLRATLEVALRLLNGRLGYAALGRPDSPSWSALVGKGDEAGLRARVSNSVQRLTQQQGQGIVSPLALLDPRFDASASVKTSEIQSVVCAPFGTGETMGVLYVEGRAGTRYSDDDLRLLEGVARLASLVVRRLLASATTAADPTARWRARLKADALVGRSAALASVLENLALVAPTRAAPVLLVGPTGTGKTALARVLHDSSLRAGGPFVQVDCTRLRPEMAAADLFGATKGAYTGLDRDRRGFVEEAEGGTLFLDELGELAVEVQRMLLLFVENLRYHRVGSTQERPADVRVVAATGRDVAALEPALLHRLGRPAPIVVPSLGERREDIPLLVSALLVRVAEEYGLAPLLLDDDALEDLVFREWPGNVRQLENAIARRLLRAHADQAAVIRAAHLAEGGEPAPPAAETLHAATERFRQRMARRAVDRCRGNKSQAAEQLGITRETLYRILGKDGEPE